MELLSYPKADYLLDASLESLHIQSVEWLKEIDFWKEEITFFYKVLHTKDKKTDFPTQEFALIEKDLVIINGDMLDKVKNEVMRHERLLASVVQTGSIQEEESYRETHRVLLSEIYSAQIYIRNFKRNVFSFIKKYNHGI